jgi:ribonuclease HIII
VHAADLAPIVPSDSARVLVYRRASGRFASLRAALASAGFRAVSPPDALAEWESLDDAGTRVRGLAQLVLVEARDAAQAAAFDARFREAFPSEREIPDGGAAPERVTVEAGSDESGKGDPSQSIAVAAVAVPVAREDEARARGVRDSKSCAPAEIAALSEWICRSFAHEIRVVAPHARAEALRAHAGNESRLLAAMHAECLRGLRARVGFTLARVDRFAPDRPVARGLAAEWPDGIVDESPRGERHVSCAAASIVARAHALRSVD